ncbi:MAG: amino acid transporter [Leptolyngbya sp. PLA1]|nr:amino acid transporter [Leptolyngbya sp. PLA1]
MVVADNRPRNLSWLHAGPLLLGDWGTSRLYVLGLAFYYTAHASVSYLVAMSLIMTAVAWAYTVICRCFPHGGGVYTAARQINPLLSVIAATLLLCDFIVTAALSAVECFHYMGLPHEWVLPLSVGTILLLSGLNWLGSRRAGQFALVIAVMAIVTSALIALACIPLLREGLSRVSLTAEGVDSPWEKWESLVRIMLALSGLEAVANMTGLMNEPVARTAKRTIWPVLAEVVILNLVFGIALNALPGLVERTVPDYVTHEIVGKLAPENVPDEVRQYRDTAVRMLAEHAGTQLGGELAGRIAGVASGIIFGLLLLSAVNTAILAMVSVLYALAQDKELPKPLTRLNYSGVPWVALLGAGGLSVSILAVASDPKTLGELYAIGVVGAIAINMLCCAANKTLEMGRWERHGMWALGLLMSAVELTIIVAKPHATAFAGIGIGGVLVARWFVRSAAARKAKAEPLPEPEEGWLAALRRPPASLDGTKSRIMLAARGRDNAEYAVDMARRRGAALFGIYVRTLRVLDVQPGQRPTLEADPVGQEALGTVAVLAKEAGVPFVPIYVSSPNIAEEILDYTVTFNCETLIMGKSRRTVLGRALSGDVLKTVQELLPEGITLLTRASAHTPAELRPEAVPVRRASDDDEDVASPS